MSEKAKPYFYTTVNRNKDTGIIESADIYIFGDIKEMEDGFEALFESPADTSSYELAVQISNIPMDAQINVHINSYGGEVKEGLAIYNVLKSRNNVTTICEGFAASAASLIFCAGKKRIMQRASLLFIHEAQIKANGSPDDLQKAADDLKVITEAATGVYKAAGVNVSDEELSRMMKAETWILPEDAVRMGFATEVMDMEDQGEKPRNCAMRSIMAMVAAHPEETGNDALMEEVKKIGERLDSYEKLESMAGKMEELAEKHPEIVQAVEKLVTTATPSAGGKNKGFFNFK